MYSRMEIIDKVGVQINNIDQLYKAKIMNYTGKTGDTKELFTEVTAEELMRLDIKKRMKEITEVVREKGYRVASHNGYST